jgi:hypothetical protein
MYVAGTSSVDDVLTDVTIPFGQIRETRRFNRAKKALLRHPEINTVVGHSLGAEIAQELSTFKQVKRGRAYGSPSIIGRSKMRYVRGYGDPVSASNMFGEMINDMFHDGKRFRTQIEVGNPHSYTDLDLGH